MALTKYDIERFNAYMLDEFMENDEMMKKLFQKFLKLRDKSLNASRDEENPSSEPQSSKSKASKSKGNEPKVIEKIVEVEKIVYQDRIVEKPVEVVPKWVDSLTPFIPEIEFFDQVKSEPALADILLPEQSENIKQLIINASQWNTILRVWDELAGWVKTRQQAITPIQTAILSHCLELYNLTLSSRKAKLNYPDIGSSYDYNLHEQVMGSGDRIVTVLLPSLVNASDENVRSALIATH